MLVEKHTKLRVFILTLILVFIVNATGPGALRLLAQQPAPQQPTAAQEGFVPVDQLPPAQDSIPAPRLVGAAYAFVWLALFVYLWSIWRRLSTVERELQAVSRRVEGSRPS
jgi:CcmD family protein